MFNAVDWVSSGRHDFSHFLLFFLPDCDQQIEKIEKVWKVINFLIVKYIFVNIFAFFLEW